MFSSFWMPNQGYLLTGYTICDMQQSGLDVDLYGLMTNVIRLSSFLRRRPRSSGGLHVSLSSTRLHGMGWENGSVMAYVTPRCFYEVIRTPLAFRCFFFNPTFVFETPLQLKEALNVNGWHYQLHFNFKTLKCP